MILFGPLHPSSSPSSFYCTHHPGAISEGFLLHHWFIEFNLLSSLRRELHTLIAVSKSLSQLFFPLAQTCFSTNLPDVYLAVLPVPYVQHLWNINCHLSLQTSCPFCVLSSFSWSLTLKPLISPLSLLFISFCLPYSIVTVSITFYFCVSQYWLVTPKSQWLKIKRLISSACFLSLDGG